ncbi:MAG: ABC transporter substrate-binding protein [Actinomycetota bacterium]
MEQTRRVPPGSIAGAALALGVLAALVWIGVRLATTPGASYPLTIEDDEGTTTTLERQPTRIVSYAPQFTETLLRLGLIERIVGVSSAETAPPEALALTEVTARGGLDPDIEKIRRQKVDLVIAAGLPGATWKAALAQEGIPVVTLNATSLDDAFDDLATVGRLVGTPAEAAELADGLRSQVEGVEAAVSGRDRPQVVFETFFPPLVVAGPSSFTADLVRSAGGTLVPDDLRRGYREVDLDRLLEADPDYYLVTRLSASSVKAVRARDGFGKLRAVKEGNVVVLEDELVLRPGPRIVVGLEAVARALHP